jgi:hypothetical protein
MRCVHGLNLGYQSSKENVKEGGITHAQEKVQISSFQRGGVPLRLVEGRYGKCF